MCFDSDDSKSAVFGVPQLIHRRWIKAIKQQIYKTDRIMAIDLKISHKAIRIIVVYFFVRWI